MRTLEQTFHELTALITDQTRDLAMAMAELRSVAQQRDEWQERHRQQRAQIVASRDEAENARQSLRAAEADVAETESVNADLRTVNARLVADLAAAVQRADTAEELLLVLD